MHSGNGFPYGGPPSAPHQQHAYGTTPSTQLRPLPPLPAHLHSAFHQPHRSHSEPSVPSGAHTILNPAPGSAPGRPAGPTPPAQPGPSSQPSSRPTTPYTESKPPTPQEDFNGGAKRGRPAERDESGSRLGTPALGASLGGGGQGSEGGDVGSKGKGGKKVKVGARASIACIACR